MKVMKWSLMSDMIVPELMDNECVFLMRWSMRVWDEFWNLVAL